VAWRNLLAWCMAMLTAMAALPCASAAVSVTKAERERCEPGGGACCPDGGRPVYVPVTRGLGVEQARAVLKIGSLFKRAALVRRPTDGVLNGLVMGTNPHAGAMACAGQPIYIYVADPTHAQGLRNFHGDTVATARDNLPGKLAQRMRFRSCQTPVGLALDDPEAHMMVMDQQPPEGTPIASPWLDGYLALAVTDAFLKGLVGMTRTQAEGLMASRGYLSGWHLSAQPNAYAASPNASNAAAPHIVAAMRDMAGCEIKVWLSDPVSAGAQPTPPDKPLAPVLPITGGLVAGLLAARFLRGRVGDEALAAAAVSAAPTGSEPPLRVRPDIPGAGPLR
jgi:hypothetical protein